MDDEDDVGLESSIQKLYHQLAARVYHGPQGPYLQDFIEVHCEETKLCHVALQTKMLKLRFKGKQIINIVANKASKASYVNISECFELTEYGKQLLEDGQGGLNCVEYVLRCKGSFHDGKDSGSGSNCQKYNADNLNWCSNFGACAPNCGFSELVLHHS